MLALIQATCVARKCTSRDLFRTAYMWRFGKDIPAESLMDDVSDFSVKYKVPQYVIDYMLDLVSRRS